MENPQSAHDGSSERLPFEYEPLERPSMIRLIEVRSDRIDGLIDVSMRHVDFSPRPELSLPEPLRPSQWVQLLNPYPPRLQKSQQCTPNPITTYKCLSYTWGAPSENHKILVNGKIAHVRKNLFEFLDLATELYPNDPLWIDALCISQDDHREKSHQVQRMGTIYQNASQVVVWLGINLFDEHNWSQEAEWPKGLTGSTFKPSDFKRPRWGEALHDGMWQLHKQYGTKNVVRAVCEHPYWTRAWIAQEILLQDSIKILIGREWIMWGSFGKFLGTNLRSSKDSIPLTRQLYDAWSEAGRFEQTRGRYRLDFWYLLELRSSSGCVDIRDRIYSLLAITSEPFGDQRLIVDYKEGTEGLFWGVFGIYSAWKEEEHIRILMHALDLSTKDLDEWLITNPSTEIAVSTSDARKWLQSSSRKGDTYEGRLKVLFRKKSFTMKFDDWESSLQKFHVKATDLIHCLEYANRRRRERKP